MPTTKITIDTRSLNIPWIPGETYRVDAEEAAFIQIPPDIQPNQPLSNVFSFTINTTGPSRTATDPLHNTTNVAKNHEIEILFDRFVEPNTAPNAGTIRLFERVNNTLIKTYTPSELDYHDNKLYINVFSFLQPNKEYYLLIANNAIKDYDGLFFAGFDSNAYFFTTATSPTFPLAVTTFMTNTNGEGKYKTNNPTQAITNTPLITNNTADPNSTDANQYLLNVSVLNNQIVEELRTVSSPGYKLVTTIANPSGDTSAFNFNSFDLDQRNNLIVTQHERYINPDNQPCDLRLYALNNETWSLFQVINIHPTQNIQANLNSRFSEDGLMLIVGVPSWDSSTQLTQVGRVQIYERSSLTAQFTLLQTINSPDLLRNTFFGSQVSISPDKNSLIVASSSAYDLGGAKENQPVRYFRRINNVYTFQQVVPPGTFNVRDNFGASSDDMAFISNTTLCIVDNFYGTNIGVAVLLERDQNNNFNIFQTINGSSANRIQGCFYYNSNLHILRDFSIDVYVFNVQNNNFQLSFTFDIGILNSAGLIDKEFKAPNIIVSSASQFNNPIYAIINNTLDFIDNTPSNANSSTSRSQFIEFTPDQQYLIGAVGGAIRIFKLTPNGNLTWNSGTSTLTIEGNKTEINTALNQLSVKTSNNVITDYDGEIRLQYDLTTPANATARRFQRIYRVE
jgi:hypothetical protein